MKTKYILIGLFVIGILFFGSTIVSGVKGEEGTNGDEDKDGIADEFEDGDDVQAFFLSFTISTQKVFGHCPR